MFTPYAGPCYRCLFRNPPPPELAPNCADTGVLGVLPGVIGSIQATEALKLVLGIGESLAGRLLEQLRNRPAGEEVPPNAPGRRCPFSDLWTRSEMPKRLTPP